MRGSMKRQKLPQPIKIYEDDFICICRQDREDSTRYMFVLLGIEQESPFKTFAARDIKYKAIKAVDA